MNGKSRLNIRTWIAVMTALIVAVGAVTIIILLIQRSDHSRLTEIALLRIEEKAIHISALEWQAIAGVNAEGSLDLDLVAEIESMNDDVESYFAELGTLQADDSQLGDVHLLYGQYLASVRQEMSLLGEGRLDEARSLDEQEVDPGYESLEEIIDSISDDSVDSAQASLLSAYFGSAFTGTSAVLIIGLMFWRFDRQRRKVAESEAKRNALSASEKYFRSMVENSSDVVMIMSARGAIEYVSDSAKRVLLYKPEDMVGNHILDFVFPEDNRMVEDLLNECVKNAGANPSVEVRFRYGDGSLGYLEANCHSRLDDPRIGGIVMNSRNTTSRRQADEILRSMSLVDDLTGLYNRRGFKALAEQHLRHARRATFPTQLLFIDLDDMKSINDIHGHVAGDHALIDLAQVFRNTFRESDILGRFGGDEFVILALDTSAAKVNLLVERLHKNLTELNVGRQSRHDPLLSISLGIAECEPTESSIVDELVARADAMMYEQKRQKKAEKASGRDHAGGQA